MDVASSNAVNAEIGQRVESWLAAVKAVDMDAIIAHYAPDTVAFDAVAQLQFKGVDAYRKHWEACMAMCPGPGIFELHELDVQAEGGLGVVHALVRCGAKDDKGGENASWMRMTTCYRKIGGQWLIAHEHFSAPFDMQTGRALFDSDPTDPSRVKAIPAGMSTVTPHLVCAGAAEALDFYVKAFDARELGRLTGPQGKVVHASIMIGDSPVFVVDEFPEWSSLSPRSLKGTPVTVHLYVRNADSFFERAVASGAKVVMPLEDAFWGDRYGIVEDPYGHRWSIATHIRDVSREEVQEAARNMCG